MRKPGNTVKTRSTKRCGRSGPPLVEKKGCPCVDIVIKINNEIVELTKILSYSLVLLETQMMVCFAIQSLLIPWGLISQLLILIPLLPGSYSENPTY